MIMIVNANATIHTRKQKTRLITRQSANRNGFTRISYPSGASATPRRALNATRGASATGSQAEKMGGGVAQHGWSSRCTWSRLRLRSWHAKPSTKQEDIMSKGNLIKRLLSGGLVIAAAGFPSAAQARLNLNPPPVAVASSTAPVVSRPSVHRIDASAQPGFQWGDAGIGAAGAVALLGAGAAASGVARRRRAHGTVIG
jgi:hypothetical protein